MKFVTYSIDAKENVGILSEDEKSVIPASEFGLKSKEMVALIRELDGALPELCGSEKTIALCDVKLEAPIPEPVQDVICLGLNYREHAEEAAKSDAAYDVQRGEAVYFSKRVNRAVAPFENIDSNYPVCTELDYEVELAVIIGKDAKNVKAADAGEYIFGYTILNDVSARNQQTKHKQWYYGKSLDGFTPIGPAIVTADKLGASPKLGIRCYINGEERQNSSTGNMIFDIPYIIEELTAGMTLKAGTIIATGTPSGVVLGMDDDKKVYLKKGDIVRCEIDEIGVLENTVG